LSQERIGRLIAEHQAAIARQDDPLTHAAICAILCDLEALTITEGQALRVLAMTGARINDPARKALYRQAIDEVRRMQTKEE
jgi:hypothetical protein